MGYDVMASRTAASKKQATPQVRGFMRRRLSEGLGLVYVTLSGVLALSLATHHVTDPSFNRTSEAAIQNKLGIVGAYASDLLMQTLGVASGLICVALLAWGWRMLSKQGFRGTLLRFTALLMALVGASAVASAMVPWNGWSVATGLGGSIGMIVKRLLSDLITIYGACATMGLLTLAALPVALGLRRKDWSGIASVFVFIAAAGALVVSQVARLVRSAMRGDYEDAADDDEELKPSATGRNVRARVTANQPKLTMQVKKVKSKAAVEHQDIEEFEEEVQASLDLLEKQGDFSMPSINLLAKPLAKGKKKKQDDASLGQNAELLEKTLSDFGIKGEITRVRPGPVVTLYELEPSAGTKSSRVIGLSDDIARSMSATSARIAVIPGRNALGIELPNAQRETVYLREMFEHESYRRTEARLPLVLGKDIGGEPVIADLARMPHLLVAGTTGSGKSVAINTMIMSLIYHHTPEQCRFIMIDPKMLELSVYDDIPHLLSPVVTEPGKAVVALKWTVREMENRYRLMSNLGVRNIDNYNKRIKDAADRGEELFRTVQTGFDPETGRPVMEKQALDMNPLPYIVVVVDEMADLMLVAGKEIETSVQRLAQMARAAGIHIIMATQRPSVDVITGVIKANFPTRVSFQVTSKIDSRTILGEQGAEQLLGQGDMLYMAGGGRIQRVHGPFINDKEVERIVGFLREQGSPEYVDDVTKEDEMTDLLFGGEEGESDADKALYDQAVAIVLRDQKASTSYIQRKLKIGYNRAARIIEQMEEEGLVGSANHVGKREVLHRSSA